MRIGFDAKRAFLNRTGLGNYSRWLIDGLASFYPENEYFLYTPKLSDRHIPATSNTFVKTPAMPIFTSRWRSSGIVRDLVRDEIKLYHGLSHELPIGVTRKGIRSVVTVHDLIFMRFPQYFKWLDRLIYKAKIRSACRIADKIVAVSKKTKNDLVELLNIDPQKIEVIYQGCDPSLKTKLSQEQLTLVRAKYDLPDKYLLTVGTIEKRKNLLVLIKALKHVSGIPLVVVGKPTKYLEKVKEYITNLQLTEQVIFLHRVPFADLPAIYQGASCFIYPSRYEGFGIPILEALVSRVPVVAATDSCLEEAGGPNSLYADPDNDVQLAEHINSILSDENLCQKMINAGLKYSANFTDDKLIGQYAALYQNVMQNA